MSQILQKLFDNDVRVPDFYFDVKTDVIYLIKSIAGKKEKISSGIKRPNILQAKREAMRKLKKKLNLKRVKITSLIKDELDAWEKVKEGEGHKYDTMNNIRRARRQIEPFWGSMFPSEITVDNVAEWYIWWAKNNPDIEMENAVKYMRNFCKYLAQKVVNGAALLPAVPSIKDPNYKQIRAKRAKKKERIFTGAEFKVIYEKAESEEHQLIVMIMYTMATRITETLEMRFGEEILMDLESPIYRWTVGQNKADLWGHHTLHRLLIPGLKRLEERRKAEGTKRLFPQIRDNQKPMREQMIDWAAWRERANLGWHWTPHTFRHTCLSNLFNDERNPQALILKLYRVSLAVALETYIKPTESGRLKMRDAIEVLL